jgi:hypothetical protein
MAVGILIMWLVVVLCNVIEWRQNEEDQRKERIQNPEVNFALRWLAKSRTSSVELHIGLGPGYAGCAQAHLHSQKTAKKNGKDVVL